MRQRRRVVQLLRHVQLHGGQTSLVVIALKAMFVADVLAHADVRSHVRQLREEKHLAATLEAAVRGDSFQRPVAEQRLRESCCMHPAAHDTNGTRPLRVAGVQNAI